MTRSRDALWCAAIADRARAPTVPAHPEVSAGSARVTIWQHKNVKGPSISVSRSAERTRTLKAPAASCEATRHRMLAVRQRDTGPELALRKAVHRLGLRYFVDSAPMPSLRRRADLVFPRIRLAVFVDGCFWHGCEQHRVPPVANASWWQLKIARTRSRDKDTSAQLQAAGWTVIRVWEHDDAEEAALLVHAAVTRLRASPHDSRGPSARRGKA
jgi:DNA mismatch endonuclease (patch repair protein)